MSWTILANGAEVSLAEYRISAVQRRRSSQAIDLVAFVLDGVAFDADLPLVGDDEVIIKKDGEQWFVGRVTAAQRSATGSAESIRYEVSGPWWYLEQLVFQQTWHIYQGPDVHKSHCLLNQWADGTNMGTRDQLAEALNWAVIQATAAYGSAPFQFDSASFPQLFIPVDEVRDITCAEAVSKQLRWLPDAVAWFDYATTPPTFHCRRRSDLEVKDITGNTASAVTLVPRFDLQVPAVVLKYERIDTVNGQSIPSLFIDAAPSTATGAEFGALCQTIDLQGGASTTATAEIVSQALPGATKTDEWWAWLKTKEGWLATEAPELIAVESVTRTPSDPTLQPLDLELVSGQIADWMTFKAQPETVKVRARILVKDSNGVKIDTVTKDFSVNIITTNGPSGVYRNTSVTAVGELPPVGLAQAVYDGLKDLEHEGSFSLVSEELSDATPTIGDRLNLTGLRPEWATMAVAVQEVTEDIDSGTVTLRVGPPSHLGPRDLVELLRVNRFRWVYTSSATRAGKNSGGGAIGLGKTTPKENSSSGSNVREFLKLRVGSGSITLDAALCGSLDVTVREVSICVNGSEKKMLILASEPY